MCREKLFQGSSDVADIINIVRNSEWEDFDIPSADILHIPQIPHIEADVNLIETVLSIHADGMAKIDSRMASSTLVLAANVATALESMQGFPLEGEEMAEFGHIVKAMYSFLRSKEGEKMQVR